jgi:hypothetical protein
MDRYVYIQTHKGLYENENSHELTHTCSVTITYALTEMHEYVCEHRLTCTHTHTVMSIVTINRSHSRIEESPSIYKQKSNTIRKQNIRGSLKTLHENY